MTFERESHLQMVAHSFVAELIFPHDRHREHIDTHENFDTLCGEPESVIFKYIAKSRSANDTTSIRAYLLAETGDMDVDSALSNDNVTPNIVHYFLTG